MTWRRPAIAQVLLGGLLVAEAAALVIGSFPEGGPGLAVVPPIVLWGLALMLLARPLGRARSWAAIASLVLVGGPGLLLAWLAITALDGNDGYTRAQIAVFEGLLIAHAAACIGLAVLLARAVRAAR